MLKHFFCAYGYLSELIFTLLLFGDKGVRVLTGSFHRSKILWHTQNFQWVHSSVFPNGKHVFFSNSLIKIGMQCFFLKNFEIFLLFDILIPFEKIFPGNI